MIAWEVSLFLYTPISWNPLNGGGGGEVDEVSEREVFGIQQLQNTSDILKTVVLENETC